MFLIDISVIHVSSNTNLVSKIPCQNEISQIILHFLSQIFFSL
jgi:hypothetical protein